MGGSVAQSMCQLVKCDFRSRSGSHQSTAWIQNPNSSRVWQYLKLVKNVANCLKSFKTVKNVDLDVFMKVKMAVNGS